MIAIYKILWFWSGRRDITTAVLVSGLGQKHPSLVRQVGAVLLPYILIVVSILILVASHLSTNFAAARGPR